MKYRKALVIRVTNRCNFKCDFCSAANLPNQDLSAKQIIALVKQYQPVQSICFEGGDPLCIKPSIYKELLAWLDQEQINDVDIGFTSNLWDFYLRPEKWLEIFKDPRVNVCTSFQFGNQRKLCDKKIFTEELFIEVYNKFKALVNKPLPFIAVISEENEDSVLQTVKLAKELKTTCKINPTFALGKAKTAYPFYKIISHYADIICAGLAEYEDNCLSLINCITIGDSSNCPFNRQCSNVMRCVNQDGTCTTCSLYASSSYAKYFNENNELDPTKDPSISIISNKCLTCPHFAVCNSCRVHIKEIQHQDLDSHCQFIHNSISRIKEYLKAQDSK